MTYTVRDLLTSSLRLINVLSEGEVMSGVQARDALVVFNDLLGSWNLQDHLLTYQQSQRFPLVVGKSQYTLGRPSPALAPTDVPDFIGDAPVRLLSAFAVANQTRYAVSLMSPRDYVENVVENVSGSYVEGLYYERQYPYATLIVYPTPSRAHELLIIGTSSLRESTLDTDMALFAPGYALALRYNVAVHLAMEYGRDPSASVVNEAMTSKAIVKASNIRPSDSITGLPSSRHGHAGRFDLITKSYRG